MDLDLPKRVRLLMDDFGVSALELRAVIEDPDRVETWEALVAYYGRVADRSFRIVAIADTEPLKLVTFSLENSE